MKLYDNWREIYKKAWSVRFAAIALIFSALEAIVPFYADTVPRGVFAVLSGIASVAGLWARGVYQKSV